MRQPVLGKYKIEIFFYIFFSDFRSAFVLLNTSLDSLGNFRNFIFLLLKHFRATSANSQLSRKEINKIKI
jgi:hypothetical protein